MTHPTRAELAEAMARARRAAYYPGRIWEPFWHDDTARTYALHGEEAVLTTLCTLIPGLSAILDGTAKVVPVKLLTEAHACMRETGWQLAPACDDGSDGVLNAAVAEIEGRFAALLATPDATP